jgi:pimeloyl-ACP methyl ester carboxylesterase
MGNTTINDLIQDSKKALDVLIQQPEVDPKRISIIGHSEGTFIAPRVAIDNSTKIKNIILMGAMAQDARDLLQYQAVSLPLQYAIQVLDKNHTGHVFYPSSQWSRGAGVGIEQYVLADIYSWLEAHSGLSHSYATTTTVSSTGANTSSSGKR